MEFTLDTLHEGRSARIVSLASTGTLRRRLLELGLSEGTEVCCLRGSRRGGPALYLVRSTLLALRRRDCQRILAEPLCR